MGKISNRWHLILSLGFYFTCLSPGVAVATTLGDDLLNYIHEMNHKLAPDPGINWLLVSLLVGLMCVASFFSARE